MKLEDKAGHPAAAGGRNYHITIALLLALIVFGSLYPLTWNFAQPQDFIFRGPVGLVDLLENVILFLPPGWLLGWNDLPGAMSWLPFASSLSGSIEAVVTSAAFESLCFGAIIWSAVRIGAARGGMTVFVAIVALGRNHHVKRGNP